MRRRPLRCALIVLGLLVLGCVVVAGVVVITTGGAILTGGVPLGGVTFTSGDLAGLPVYPGVAQSTDSAGVTLPDDMRRVGGANAPWKRYLTADDPQKVMDWYDQALPKIGYQRGQPRPSGLVIYTTSNTRFLLWVVTLQGRTNIFQALVKE